MLYPKMVYRLILERLKQFINGQCQAMSQKCENSLGLQIIIKDSSTTPILVYANFEKPFKLHTDASV